MPVLIDDTVLNEVHLSEDEMLLEIAILLYSQRRLSMGRASRFASMNRIIFQRVLGERGVEINFDLSDLEEDLETLGINLN